MKFSNESEKQSKPSTQDGSVKSWTLYEVSKTMIDVVTITVVLSLCVVVLDVQRDQYHSEKDNLIQRAQLADRIKFMEWTTEQLSIGDRWCWQSQVDWCKANGFPPPPKPKKINKNLDRPWMRSLKDYEDLIERGEL